MKTLHHVLLGAGLLLTGPVAGAQHLTEYSGTWLNTAPYTQSVTRLEVGNAGAWSPSLFVWEGPPANATRRSFGYAAYRPAPNGVVTRLVVRLLTADVAELYYLDLQPDGALWVLRHTSQAGTTVRCDTMRFERLRHPDAVRNQGARYATNRLPSPAEVAVRFTPVGTPIASKSFLVAFQPR